MKKKHKLEGWDLERVYITAIQIAWDEVLFSLEIKQSFGHSATGLRLCPRFFMGFSHLPCCPAPIFPFPSPPICFPPQCSFAHWCLLQYNSVSQPCPWNVTLHIQGDQSIKVFSEKTIASSRGTLVPDIQIIHFFFTLQQSKCPLCVRFYNWYIIWCSRSLLMLINIVNVKPTKINQQKTDL